MKKSVASRQGADPSSVAKEAAAVGPASETPVAKRRVFESHEDYFDAQPAEVRPLLEWIQKTTESVVPGRPAW